MSDIQRKKLNQERLLLIDESIRPLISAVLTDMESHGYSPLIDANVFRTPEKQLELFRKGVSKARWGFHCAMRNGKPGSLAADIVDANTGWNVKREFWFDLARAALTQGLGSGIFFGLNTLQTQALRTAIMARNYSAKLQTGWDPAHCQTARVSIAEAKIGKR